MHILAIETVGTSGSVAALLRDALLVERPLDGRRRSAQSLAPAIGELLAEVGWRPTDVELVAVATGPGSFTGLRIGVTTAKVFAYAAGSQAIGVPTLSAIAARVPDTVPRFSVVLDAQRDELFAADFSRESGGRPSGLSPTRVVGYEAWLGALTPGTVVTGPGLERLAIRLPEGVVMVDRTRWAATAAAVGHVGWQQYAAGERMSVFEVLPNYYRKSAAEEKQDRMTLG